MYANGEKYVHVLLNIMYVPNVPAIVPVPE